ncbi:MAG: hypothetical protein J6M30_02720 [Bacteroidales bacterium]|nr:hypothetical protein [Bacteroidales bacterium]
MKKLVLFGAALLMLVTSNVKAQISESGQNYVKLQFVQPLGEYKDFYNSGIGVEFGRMFPLNFDIADGMIIPGLDITFIHTTINTGKDHEYFTVNDGTDSYLFKTQGGLMWDLGVKLGPMVTVGITDGLVADFAIQYDPTVIFNFRKGVNSSAWEDQQIVDKKSGSSVSFAHRIGIKADIRYTRWLFGLEFLLGSTSLHYNHDIIPYSKNAANDVKFVKEKDMGIGTLLLNFGVTF